MVIRSFIEDMPSLMRRIRIRILTAMVKRPMIEDMPPKRFSKKPVYSLIIATISLFFVLILLAIGLVLPLQR